jgi:hypothetical protein
MQGIILDTDKKSMCLRKTPCDEMSNMVCIIDESRMDACVEM